MQEFQPDKHIKSDWMGGKNFPHGGGKNFPHILNPIILILYYTNRLSAA
jgi:hypothetical protein